MSKDYDALRRGRPKPLTSGVPELAPATDETPASLGAAPRLVPGPGRDSPAEAPDLDEPAGAPVSPRLVALPALPLAALRPGYVSNHIEARLDVRQSCALAQLLDGLVEQQAQTADSKPVKTRADALRFVLEQLAAGDDAAAA